jgi:hypothetical protein
MSWPITYGKVESGTLEETRNYITLSSTPPCDAAIRYSYSVNDQHYCGCYRRTFCSEGEAREFLPQFPIGATVPVHFDPARPRNSQVRDEDLDRLISQSSG